MSAFPYSMASPPPTAGPLTIIDRANQSTPYSGGGGGGGTIISSFNTASVSSLSVSSINGATPGTGSIPTNLNVSTLGVADSLSVGGGLALGKGIVDIGNLPTSQDITMEILGYNSGTAALFGMSITSDTNTNTMTISSVGATPILLNNISTINGVAYPPPGGSAVSTFDTASISSLSVSSINGAAPGTGGGASIAEGGAFVLCSSNGVIVMGHIPGATLPDIQIGDSMNTVGISLQNAQGDSLALFAGTIGFTTQNVNMTGTNLNVSSINGGAYPPPGGSAPQFSTLFSGSSTINCDGGQTQVLLSFSTLTNHLYQIQPSILIQGNGGQEGTLDDDVVLEVPAVITLNTLQGSFISTANAAARDVNIGMGGMFRAAGGGLSLAINGTFSTSAQLNSVNLVDFGAV